MALKKIRMLQKFDTETNWTANDPVLYMGEFAISTDLDPVQFKIGNGVDVWSDLPYYAVDVDNVTYTNANPTTATIGGIAAGSTFNEWTMKEMWDALLYPYQYPAFSTFNISGMTTPREVGQEIPIGNYTFTWTTTNSGNVEPNTVEISGPGMTTVSGLANDGTEVIPFTSSVNRVTQGSLSWVAEAENTIASTFTKTYSVNWYWRIYWGTNAAPSIGETEIEALVNGQLKSTHKGVYTMPAATLEYKYLAYPATMALAVEFKDVDTNLTFPFDYLGTVNLTNAYGITQAYRVYRSTNQAGGEVELLVN